MEGKEWREELAWAAGFFDGEGSIYTAKMGKKAGKHTIHLDIAQTDPEVLNRFYSAVSVGKVYGPYTPKTKNSRPYWRYTAASYKSCQYVIAVLWEFLSPVKKLQAERCLTFIREVEREWAGREKIPQKRKPHSDETKRKIKESHLRRWAALREVTA